RERPRARICLPLLHHAERAALDIAQHDPGHLALPDVEVGRAQSAQPCGDLLLLRPAAQIEMQPLRGGIALGDAGEAEIEVGLPVDVQPRLEEHWRVGERGGAESRLPEAAEAAGVEGVDAEVLEEHPVSLRGAPAQPTPSCARGSTMRWER